MNSKSLERTRRALHGVAELVLAGPQYESSHDIRLRVTPGGFGTVTSPDLRVDGLELVTSSTRLPLEGTFAALARAARVEARPLRDVYSGGPDINPHDHIVIDQEAADILLDAFATGDAAMRAFAPTLEPVLWPEHFDLGITVAKVNYGVSPGDLRVPEPYAYVGPWTPLVGAFWNVEFGAARPLSALRGVDELVAFFEEGARRTETDPPSIS